MPQLTIQSASNLIGYCTIILLIFASVVSPQMTFSLGNDPAYVLLRDCVHTCLAGPYGVPDYLGCNQNACVCRPDLQISGDDFLTTCINNYCDNDPSDVSTAVSLYSSYCSVNGYNMNATPSSAVATTTSGGSSSPTPASQPHNPTASTSSSSPSIQTPRKFPVVAFLAMVYLIIPIWYAPIFTPPIYA